MSTFIEHIVRLTDHRDRDLLELTLSKALLELLPVSRIVIARVMREEGESRWLEVARLDAKGGGRVIDPTRIDFSALVKFDDAPDRVKCLALRDRVEIAWAGAEGPRITLLPLFSQLREEDQGVLELHSEAPLNEAHLLVIDSMCRIYRNMYSLLEFSDRDALTGLLNRKSLDDAFYSAVLEDMNELPGTRISENLTSQERRHHVPANYWLGSVKIDNFSLIAEQHGRAASDEILSRVARIFSNTFRTYDRLYRLSDDHFGVLLHCPDEALVLGAFERFKSNVEKYTFTQVGRVTVSCGFTNVLADDSPRSALDKTVKAVDFAKRSGGNKACSYPGLAQRGFFGVPEPTPEVKVV
ncbi:GGDEF domain-containing protein [Rhodoferax sp.]|uniref:GGDEF domain-containing protein n=1 Tax=Rhodoferax sp. TaxID=50421 RepID=UPI002632BEFE|nr:GGDEF domain-containing protein [Rhodoferax sp.]MDD2808840.1 GGDEF domain-containing protein [Rhodoferax sp.]MDD4942447.1 GGDEF domain-containing protein [Rhodoferax sp.]